MWAPASANLTCDFIKTGLHHGHIIAECSDFFMGKLFHKKNSDCDGYFFVQ